MPRSPFFGDGTLLTLGIVGAAAGLAVARPGSSGSRARVPSRAFLRVPVKNEAEARAFLAKLVKADLEYHLEENPANIVIHRTGRRLFTDAELPVVRARVAEVFRHLGDPFGPLIDLCNRRDIPRIWEGKR